ALPISQRLNISQSDYPSFRDLLKKMEKAGKINREGREGYTNAGSALTVTGTLHVKTQGYGFVIQDDGKTEIFVSQRNMGTAIHKDRVKVQLFAKPRRKELHAEGKVVEILERNQSNIVGIFREGKYFNYVVPDNLKIVWDILIPPKMDLKAKSGQKVVVKILEWEHSQLNPEGEIVEILGYPDESGVDVLSVAKSLDLPVSFSKTILEEAEKIPQKIPASEIDRRLDLREEEIFTIDPEDAKDFDDAVSLEILENGFYKLGVHIANVSFYVSEGHSLDNEALHRGTSVYLVDRVIPMLPERLSNEVCSLRPGEDRLTFSVIMILNRKGVVTDYEIRESIIRSKRRFSYEEVQEIIDSGNGDFTETLRQMRDLGQLLRRKRIAEGSLDFETPEVKVILDDKGHPLEIRRVERLESHQLIEEFMLLANRIVALHVAFGKDHEQKKNRGLPFIYRVHPRPSQDKIRDFKNLVETLGHKFPGKKGQVGQKQLQKLLEQVKSTPEEIIVNNLMLRSMMKAEYSTKNIGHFGLGFSHYTHFTSPIRRYPDLQVHRLLKKYEGKITQDQKSLLEEKLSEVCKIASEQEIRALEAERKSIKMKQVEFMADKLGEEYFGIISGVVPFGIFVELEETLVEGLVHVKDLPDDHYFYDEKKFSMIGKNTGVTFRLGNRIKVKLVRVKPNENIIDFILADQKV
ncbi:MAG TPA: ribonuclease R, partial [Bacteroidetes bacterium]|nr:ribonuclease R [Bacteroidota bacterium]